MIALFDQKQVITDYIASEKRLTREATEKATREEERMEFYIRLRLRGFTQEEAQEMSEISDKLIPNANKLLEKYKSVQ